MWANKWTEGQWLAVGGQKGTRDGEGQARLRAGEQVDGVPVVGGRWSEWDAGRRRAGEAARGRTKGQRSPQSFPWEGLAPRARPKDAVQA